MELSDYESLKNWYANLGIPLEEDERVIEENCSTAKVLHLEVPSQTERERNGKVHGYYGFYTEWWFNVDGEFLYQTIYE